MDGRFNGHHHPEFTKASEKPVDPTFPSGKMSATASPKRSRRGVQKRVVSVPIGDGDRSRAKGEAAPPSDSWAWRKYGQKPIKGSPYPRGYYRCSSSKGCPARKQVERSRVDPTMLVITYASEHNHPWPVSRNANGTKNNPSHVPKSSPEEPELFSSPPEIESDDKFADIENDATLLADEFCWFSDVASSPTVDSVLHNPICAGSIGSEYDVEGMLLPSREVDESLFADLGELPECSVVFRSRFYEEEEESRRCSLRPAPWCGSTG